MTTCWCGGEVAAIDHENTACLESRLHDPLATGEPESVTRLYVAGPMSGYADCNYPLFNRVADKLRGHGWEVVNPAEVHLNRQHHYVDLIREDLKQMLTCDGVATLDDWERSKGASNEVRVARFLNMPVQGWREFCLPPHIYNRSLHANRR